MWCLTGVLVVEGGRRGSLSRLLPKGPEIRV